jgi:hypothetical protein
LLYDVPETELIGLPTPADVQPRSDVVAFEGYAEVILSGRCTVSVQPEFVVYE